MTHDCDRATECLCYQAGYLNGQQTDEGTLAWLADSFELTAGRTLVSALTIPLALSLAAGWVEWEALAGASRVLFVGMAADEGRRQRDMTEETYSRPEVDGDLSPFGHGRGRRCCAACSVLANATAKFQDGRYPWTAPPTVETLEAVQKHRACLAMGRS